MLGGAAPGASRTPGLPGCPGDRLEPSAGDSPRGAAWQPGCPCPWPQPGGRGVLREGSGAELRAAGHGAASPGPCVPLPLRLCLPCTYPGLSRAVSCTAPPWGCWAASSGQGGVGAGGDRPQLLQLCAQGGEIRRGKLLARLPQVKPDLSQPSSIDGPVLPSQDPPVICHHCSLQECPCPKEQRAELLLCWQGHPQNEEGPL